MKSSHSTDRIFQEKLGDYASDAPMHIWDRIDQKRSPKRRAWILFRRNWGMAFLVLLLIGSAGYFMVENAVGKMSFSRRGDFARGMGGFLLNGAGQKMLDTSLVPIEVPPFKKIFVTESGQVYIQPVGAEPNTRVLVNQIALNSGVEDNIVKDIDGELRPKGGFDRTKFNPDQNAQLQQGYIEESNVNVFEELVQNTDLMKRFQLNTKLISIAKDLDESSASLLRMPNG